MALFFYVLTSLLFKARQCLNQIEIKVMLDIHIYLCMYDVRIYYVRALQEYNIQNKCTINHDKMKMHIKENVQVKNPFCSTYYNYFLVPIS